MKNILHAWKLIRLMAHLVIGLLTVSIGFKLSSELGKKKLTQRWSKKLVRLLGIHLHVVGTPPSLYSNNTLIVSNHISWVDIFIINAVCPARFIAKSEIAGWPIMGWLCKKAGTLFIDREKARDTRRINSLISSELAAGGCVAFFPEGTTTEGEDILKFSGALFQPAIMAKSIIQPVAILYADKEGRFTTTTAYVGDTSLKTTLTNMLSSKGTSASTVFLPPQMAEGQDRKTITKSCEESIRYVVSRHANTEAVKTQRT